MWHLIELYATEALDTWRLYLLLVVGLKVINVAQLARLGYTLAAREAFVAKVDEGVINIVKKAVEEHHCRNGSACTPFSRIAVHDYHVFRIRYSQIERKQIDTQGVKTDVSNT